MQTEEIIRMAREAGVWDEIGYPKCIERFAALIAAHEREAVMEIVNTIGGDFAVECAEAIQARGE